MNKSEEAVMKIDLLTEEIEKSSATEAEKKEMKKRLLVVVFLMMESHLMVAKCKRILMENGLIQD